MITELLLLSLENKMSLSLSLFNPTSNHREGCCSLPLHVLHSLSTWWQYLEWLIYCTNTHPQYSSLVKFSSTILIRLILSFPLNNSTILSYSFISLSQSLSLPPTNKSTSSRSPTPPTTKQTKICPIISICELLYCYQMFLVWYSPWITVHTAPCQHRYFHTNHIQHENRCEVTVY
jgi:hypothetical protein